MTSRSTAAPRPAVLLLDKPAGPTSHDVVARVRRAAGTRKVGHAGTLDPMATGLLLLGVGSATRLLTHLVGLDKTYTATIRLGASTTTDDAQGELTEPAHPDALAGLDRQAIERGMRALTGDISQVPSAVSAIKVAGRRAYDLVRAGEQVELAARPVSVRRFDLLDLRELAVGDARWLDLDVVVDCSSGTYVRALARDLGNGLGVGGHLTALRRTRIGPFDVADAAALDDPLAASLAPANAAARLFPTVRLDADQALALRQGKRVRVPLGADPVPVVAAIDPEGELIGLFAWDGAVARVIVNFPVEEVGA